MRKVFLEDLPRHESGTSKGRINWNECMGVTVNFIYENIVGEIKILKYYPDNKKALKEYELEN